MRKKSYHSIYALFLLSLLVFVSCNSKDGQVDVGLVGQTNTALIDQLGEPSSVDTITCWHIGNSNTIELSAHLVYDFYVNSDDNNVQELNHRRKEDRQLKREYQPSIIDVRLMMAESDVAFLKPDIIRISHYYYYNYGLNKRFKVENNVVLQADAGKLSELAVLDKIRLNLGADSMMIINITLAFIMFGVALNMKVAGFKLLLKNPKSLIVGLVSQFLVLPLVTFLLILVLKPIPSIALGMVLVAACPGGNVSNFICSLAKGNLELSVAMTASSTILAVVMTPINFAFWGGLYASSSGLLVPINIDWWEMTKIVFLLLGLPIVVGMTVRYMYPKLSEKIEKPMRYFSLVFFIALVIGAIFQNYVYFTVYAKLILGTVLLHNFLAFSTGYSLSSLMKLPRRDRRSITIETGIQNSGLALVLIVNPHLFNGLGGMAFIAAVWGVWHIVSGMALGSFWNYLRK